MTTWNLDAVRAVWNMHADVHIDRSYVNDQAAYDVARQKAARAITEMAHIHAEIDPADVKLIDLVAHPQDGLFGRFRHAWRPDPIVTLTGPGPYDGDEVQVRDVWSTLMMPVLGGTLGEHVDDRIDSRAESGYLMFRVAGWSEASRRWIFTPH